MDNEGMAPKRLHNENEIRTALGELAQALITKVPGPKGQWALVGIQRRGVFLAHRLAAALEVRGA